MKKSRYASKYVLPKKFRLDQKILGVPGDFFIIAAIFLVFSLLFSLLAVTRHNHFQSQGIDFSVYDQALWLYSRFERPFSTVGGNLDLADRFRPIMLLISPLYWFTGNERVLLIFQAVILSSAVFPVWLIARRYLPWILAVGIAFVYVDFIGIQAVNAYDFHEMSALPLLLAWLFYFLEKGHWKSFFGALILCLAVREHVGLIISFLGIYIWTAKKNLKIGVVTSIISIAWSVLAIKLVMPLLGQHSYDTFVMPGDSLGGAVTGYIFSPVFAVRSFFLPFGKIETLFWTFFSFGFLPLIAFSLIPIIGFQFASRFLDLMHPIRWTIYYHYSAELAVLMSVATIIAAGKIIKRFGRSKKIVLILLVLVLVPHFVTNAILHAPLKNLLKRQFWQNQPWTGDNKIILSLIPKNASVASQNSLLPHMSHRREIFLLPKVSGADYIMIDLHPGQDNWDFYTSDLAGTKLQMKQIILTGKYNVMASAGDSYLLRRQGKNLTH